MFEGISTALVTPFRDGAVDEPALRDLVERQIAAGIDAVVPCGSTGESATLSHDEHSRVVQVVVDAAGGRTRVLAGTGSNNTREAVELTRRARDAGADGALLISPYYNKPTQEGIYEHFARIAEETAFPLVVYNIPGRTASNIQPETLARLADLEYVVGVKESCGDLDQIAHVVALCPDDFAVLSGDGDLTLPLFDALFCETNPIPVKAALALMGRIGDEIRLPLTPLTDANRERLQVVLKELGFV